MTLSRFFLPLILPIVLAGCQSIGFDGFPSSQRGEARYRCSDNVTLTVERAGATATASDSRGYSAAMPASPAGQKVRYAEGIHALILEGRNATWFVSGQKPMECTR